MDSNSDPSGLKKKIFDQEQEIQILRDKLEKATESQRHSSTEFVNLNENQQMSLSDDRVDNLERHYKAILENSPDGVVMINIHGEMSYASPSARRMFGFDSTEKITFDPADYTHPDDLEKVLGELFKTMNLPDYLPTIQYRFRSKQGEWKWIESVFSNQLAEPFVNSIVINFRDIHDKMLILEDLKAAKEGAELANRVKDSFISAISHEIRTPLTGIIGMVEVIADSLDEKCRTEFAPYFNSIHRSSDRLISTIEDILNFSLLQYGDFNQNQSVVQLNQLIYNVIKELKPLADDKSIGLNVSFSSDNFEVFVDPTSLSMAMLKIVGNAIKFSEKGEVRVEVKESEQKDFITIEVKDTGVGISEKFFPQLFSPFTQEESGYGRTFEGLGLGLPIIKKLIDLMNATIEVQSTKNVGTSFVINIKKFDSTAI